MSTFSFGSASAGATRVSVSTCRAHRRADTDGRQAVAEYILRSPFSQEKLRYQAKTGDVIYLSKMYPVLKRNFEVFSACDWLAALTAHIPNTGEHLVRYYGWNSNVNWGEAAERTDKGRGRLNPRGLH